MTIKEVRVSWRVGFSFVSQKLQRLFCGQEIKENRKGLLKYENFNNFLSI